MEIVFARIEKVCSNLGACTLYTTYKSETELSHNTSYILLHLCKKNTFTSFSIGQAKTFKHMTERERERESK